MRSGSRLSALVLAAVVADAAAVVAQESDVGAHVLDLEPTVLDLAATVNDMSGTAEDISATAQATLERSGDIEVRRAGDDFILSVASDVLFGFDSADLSGEARRSLTDVAEIVARAPDGQVLVVGHTDAKGSDDYNLALSERRAVAVAAFLMAEGVPADRLGTEGRGEAEPVAENEVGGSDNPEGRARNRRVEFVVPKAMLQD